MNTPAALDDYLLDLLGDAAAPAATPSTPHVVAVATVDAGVRQNDTTAAEPPVVDATPSAPVAPGCSRSRFPPGRWKRSWSRCWR